MFVYHINLVSSHLDFFYYPSLSCSQYVSQLQWWKGTKYIFLKDCTNIMVLVLYLCISILCYFKHLLRLFLVQIDIFT